MKSTRRGRNPLRKYYIFNLWLCIDLENSRGYAEALAMLEGWMVNSVRDCVNGTQVKLSQVIDAEAEARLYADAQAAGSFLALPLAARSARLRNKTLQEQRT